MDQDEQRAAVVAAHNIERSRRHLSPVQLNVLLSEAAQTQADDMSRRDKMSHRGADGSSPFERIARAGYQASAAAENVAFGFQRVDEVMAGWMRSPGHRRNILGPYREVGVGYAIGRTGTSFWCVTFGAVVGQKQR